MNTITMNDGIQIHSRDWGAGRPVAFRPRRPV